MSTLLHHVVPVVRDFEQLFAVHEQFQDEPPPGSTYLRGHAVHSWGLVPTIGRRDFYTFGARVISQFNQEQEWKLLHRFRRYAHAYAGRALGTWENLFLARHHSLPVRLLDWSSNPLVALFYAVEPHSHITEDGAVWLLKRKADTTADIDVLDDRTKPLEIRGVRVIYPTYVSERLIAQSGCFTIHGYPWENLTELDPTGLDPADLDIVAVQKVLIPACVKAELAGDVMRASVNSRTLFPDLDGLAKGLVELEAIRQFG